MRKFIPKAATLPAIILAGCSTLQPPLPDAEPGIASQWPIPEAISAPVPGDHRAAVDVGWREFFTDPKLEALIGLALENNRDLRVALLNVERSRALYRIQRADRLPALGASGSYTRSGGGAVVDVEQFRADLGLAEFEIDLFGRVRNLSEGALQRYLATEEARRATQLVLIAEVADAYLTLAADLELQAIADATMAIFEEELQLTERRLDFGAASSLDVSQARTIVASARADTALFAGQVEQDRNALMILVGAQIDPNLWPEAFQPEVTGLLSAPPGLPSEVLLRRPDILSAEHELRASNADIGAARAAFFPSITLTGSTGSVSGELSGLFEDGTGIWSFMPRINIPIFQGGRLRANRDAAVAGRDIALARYEQAIQNGFREVADALALSWSLASRRAALEDMVAAAEEAHRLSETRYRSGQVSYLTLLDAQRTLYGARQALIQAQLREQSNRVSLYRALGGGWKEEAT